MLPDWDEAALLEEVVVTPRRAFVPLPDMRLVERPGWMQILTPSFRNGGFNEVVLSVLEDGDADAVIDATIAEYRRLGLRFRWCVGPGSKPDDLAERLARRGLECAFVCGMARATSPAWGEVSESVRTEEVNARTLDAYTTVLAEGWNMDPAALGIAHQTLFGDADRRQRLYLASYKGELAAAASYIAFPHSAYLQGAVVLPNQRFKGLYRALVGARLRDAAARGLQLATSHALEGTSAPLLEHMGFETVCRFPVFSG